MGAYLSHDLAIVNKRRNRLARNKQRQDDYDQAYAYDIQSFSYTQTYLE